MHPVLDVHGMQTRLSKVSCFCALANPKSTKEYTLRCILLLMMCTGIHPGLHGVHSHVHRMQPRLLFVAGLPAGPLEPEVSNRGCRVPLTKFQNRGMIFCYYHSDVFPTWSSPRVDYPVLEFCWALTIFLVSLRLWGDSAGRSFGKS